jgi:hypothetical protein
LATYLLSMCWWANDTRANFSGFYIFASDNLRRPAQWPLAHRLQRRARLLLTHNPCAWFYTSNSVRPLGFSLSLAFNWCANSWAENKLTNNRLRASLPRQLYRRLNCCLRKFLLNKPRKQTSKDQLQLRRLKITCYLCLNLSCDLDWLCTGFVLFDSFKFCCDFDMPCFDCASQKLPHIKGASSPRQNNAFKTVRQIRKTCFLS